MFTVTFKKNEAVGRFFITLFIYFLFIFFSFFFLSFFLFVYFSMQMHILLPLFITRIDVLPVKKKGKFKLLIASANLSFLSFWCQITKFGFVFFFLLKMWKKVYNRGGRLEKFGQVTVNTLFFHLNNRSITYMCMRNVYFSKTETYFFHCFYPKVRDDSSACLFFYQLHCTVWLMVLMALKTVEIVFISFESTL